MRREDGQDQDVVAVLSLLAIVTLSIVITRVATVMLTATGLSRDVARFQARSAFSGAGFTTTESESVVNHPVRRRIVLQLMLLGAAGIVTSLTTLLLSFSDASGGQTGRRVLALAAGLLALRLLAGSRIVDRALTRLTEWVLRRYTRLDVRDYAKLLHIGDDFSVTEVEPREGDWLLGRRLEQLALREEGIIVLGIYRRDGRYVGVPSGPTLLEPGDRLVVYGEDARVCALADRPAGEQGDRAHDASVDSYRAQRALASGS